MKTTWVIAFIGSAVFLLGVAARNGGQGGPPGADSALVGGFVTCFETSGQAQLGLSIGGGPVAGGGVVGIPAGGGFATFSAGGTRPGTCADALAALALPAPLCATGPAPSGFQAGLGFACSGRARDVIEAVGDLAKAVIVP